MSIKDQIRAEIERLKIKACGSQATEEEIVAALSSLDLVIRIIDSLPEQPVEGLEEKDFVEEVRQYYSNNCTWDALKQPMLSIITRCGRHFAEWGMNQCPLPEDTTIFMKGVAEGKRLMMEEAVAVEVVGEKRDLRLIDSTQRCLFNAERGDWLKIIIVKEDGK